MNSDGKLYVYGYPNETNYSLGSVIDYLSLKEIFMQPNYIKLQADIKKLIESNCSLCSVKPVCNGTCICSSYLFDSNKSNINYSCDLARLTFMEILKINNQMEKDFITGNATLYNKYVKKYFTEQDTL